MIQPSEIETELLAFLRRDIFGADVAVTPEMDLVAAGFDSMSLVKLLLFIETKYGKWIPERSHYQRRLGFGRKCRAGSGNTR